MLLSVPSAVLKKESNKLTVYDMTKVTVTFYIMYLTSWKYLSILSKYYY